MVKTVWNLIPPTTEGVDTTIAIPTKATLKPLLAFKHQLIQPLGGGRGGRGLHRRRRLGFLHGLHHLLRGFHSLHHLRGFHSLHRDHRRNEGEIADVVAKETKMAIDTIYNKRCKNSSLYIRISDRDDVVALVWQCTDTRHEYNVRRKRKSKK